MPERKRILITGAAGRIALLAREALSPDYEVTGVDMRPSAAHPEDAVADMKDLDAIRPLFRDKDIVVDFANDPSGSLGWDDAYENNILSTFNQMRAAQEAGVSRYIYTSSNRATQGYEQDEPYASICRGDYGGIDLATFPRITASMPVRPNGPYGIGKAAAEAAGRYLSDNHGMSVICLRLGTMGREGEVPRDQRQFATTLTPRDVQELYRCAVAAPDDLRFGIFYGVSNNKWNFWDLEDAARRIAYKPQDNMEMWR
jgi:nucleoside-diphosphate-sugar epimerase